MGVVFLLVTVIAAAVSVHGGKVPYKDSTVVNIISDMSDESRRDFIVDDIIRHLNYGRLPEKRLPIPQTNRNKNVGKLPEEDMTVPEIISYMGYVAEIHQALTDDGYYLTLHRIPHGRKETKDCKNTARPVMFLQHGLLCSSSNWVTNLQNESLAFILADAGYDVWMGNARGNTYSQKHKTLSVKDSAFWNFSFDEMAKYDLPAMINYALQTTGQSQLYYVGHSQGTMMIFAGLSENVALQKKIKTFFALAPVTRLRYIYSPIKYLAPFEVELKFLFKELGINQFLPNMEAIDLIAKYVCPIDELMCEAVLELISGYEKKNLNQTRLPIYISHTPAGTSVKNMYHFAQLVKSQVFQKYDYGSKGSEDWLADPKDVAWMIEQMDNLIGHIQIPDYNHLDFIWAVTAAQDVYKTIIEMAK